MKRFIEWLAGLVYGSITAHMRYLEMDAELKGRQWVHDRLRAGFTLRALRAAAEELHLTCKGNTTRAAFNRGVLLEISKIEDKT